MQADRLEWNQFPLDYSQGKFPGGLGAKKLNPLKIPLDHTEGRRKLLGN
jgi:hypothetical protein